MSTFQIVLAYLSKIITNSAKNTDVTGRTDETNHHLLRWFTGVEVHVFTTFLRLSFLEVFAPFQNWMFLNETHFRNLFAN